MGRGTYRWWQRELGRPPGPIACGCCCRSVVSYNRRPREVDCWPGVAVALWNEFSNGVDRPGLVVVQRGLVLGGLEHSSSTHLAAACSVSRTDLERAAELHANQALRRRGRAAYRQLCVSVSRRLEAAQPYISCHICAGR